MSDPGAAVPKPLMKTTAMIATQIRISTDMADPRPKLKPVNRLL